MNSRDFVEYAFDENELQKYKKSIEFSINERYLIIMKLLNLLDISFPEQFTVMVFPKELGIGQYVGNGIVEWGYIDIFPSYQAIGIFHEYLHYVFEQVHDAATDDERWRLHGLIVLLADVYLRFLIYPADGFVLPTVDAGYHVRLVAETISLLPAFEKAVETETLSAEYLLELFELPSFSY